MKIFAIFGTVGIILLLIIHGASILIPVVIALLLWTLILSLGETIIYFLKLPKFLSFGLATVLVAAFFFFPINLAIYTLPEVVQESLKYQVKMDKIFMKFLDAFSLSKQDIWTQLKTYINFPGIVSALASNLTELTASFLLVLLYVIFLFFDHRYIHYKIEKMFPEKSKQKWIASILESINLKIKAYLWVKTLLAVLGGVVSYIFFKAVGLNFAEFWAVMIFFLGYIPTIGAILGVIFPALLCLVQFESIVPFLVVSIGCGAAHFLIGNLVEPKLLGDSMNLSTFVVMFSLVLWSTLWGIIGAFLSVPMTIIILIIFAEFPSTRPIAIALSARGKV